MVVGILQRIAAQGKDSVQVLLVLPTRELAQVTDHIVRSLGAHMDIRTQLIVGGVQQARNYKQLLRELASVQVVVSTPGRMLDAIIRGGMDPEQVRMLVLDEADETMSRGFEEVVDDMIKVLPRDIQIAMFTCTMHPECTRVAQEYMSQHVYIQHKPVQS
jgi:superfamily II DNA/RNA helicase